MNIYNLHVRTKSTFKGRIQEKGWVPYSLSNIFKGDTFYIAFRYKVKELDFKIPRRRRGRDLDPRRTTPTPSLDPPTDLAIVWIRYRYVHVRSQNIKFSLNHAPKLNISDCIFLLTSFITGTDLESFFLIIKESFVAFMSMVPFAMFRVNSIILIIDTCNSKNNSWNVFFE